MALLNYFPHFEPNKSDRQTLYVNQAKELGVKDRYSKIEPINLHMLPIYGTHNTTRQL